MDVLIQNKNMANAELNFHGKTLQCDGEGVLACSQLVADMLIDTPGWAAYDAENQVDLEGARLRVIRAEAAVQEAEKHLERSRTELERLEKRKADYKGKPPAEPPPAASRAAAPAESPKAPEKPEAAEGDIPEGEFPNARTAKEDILAFCAKYGIAHDENMTKVELLQAIEDETE